MAKWKKFLADGDRELLLPPKPMGRGSLSQRYIRCDERGCRCRTDDDARHGPVPQHDPDNDNSLRSRARGDSVLFFFSSRRRRGRNPGSGRRGAGGGCRAPRGSVAAR